MTTNLEPKGDVQDEHALDTRRGNTLPLRSFQVSLSLSILVRCLVTLCLSAVSVVICVLAYQFFAPESSWIVTRFTEDVGAVVAIVVVPLIVSVVSGFILFLRWTFRIAGPLYRYKEAFEEIERGLLPRAFQTRSGDELGFLTDQVRRGLQRVYSAQQRTLTCYDKLVQEAHTESETCPKALWTAIEELGHAVQSIRLEGTTRGQATKDDHRDRTAA